MKGKLKKFRLKFTKKQIAGIAAVLCTVAIVLPLGLRSSSAAESSSTDSTVATATVTKGTISNTISGSGTLENGDATDIVIPTGITIDEVLVESGDTVSKGDALATVDQTSVATAISEIQTSIETIDEELAALDESSSTETVTASVSGRVKDVNISSGDDAAEVTSSEGSVLTLSVDGLMAVDITTDEDFSVGDTVNVKLDGGSTVTGTVASVSDGSITVTIDDDGPEIGQKAYVSTTDGQSLGNGKLYVHEPLILTETSGTVSAVYVSENEEVDQDDSLYKLTGVTDDTTKNELISERSDLTDALTEMLSIQESGQITATCSGTVEDVNVSDDTEVTSNSSSTTDSTSTSTDTSSTTSSSTDATSSTSGTTAETSSVADADSSGLITTSSVSVPTTTSSSTSGFVLLSASTDTSTETTSTETGTETTTAAVTLTSSTSSSSSSSDSSSSSSSSSDTSSSSISYGNDYLVLPITVPEAGNTPMTTAELAAAVSKAGYNYNVQELTWSDSSSEMDSSDSFVAGETYKAYVTLTFDNEEDAYQFLDDNAEFLIRAEGSESYEFHYYSSKKKLVVTVTYETAEDTSSSSSSSSSSASSSTSGSSSSSNSSSGTSTGSSGSGSSGSGSSGSTAISSSGSGSSGSTGTASASGSTSSSTTSSSSSSSSSDTTASSDLYSSYETAGFTIDSEDTMQISISVDELDILSVEKGRSVSVELDALEGQTFDGEVSEVSTTGTNSGGSSKYDVTVTVSKTDDMLVGMSATATITVDSAEDVLTIPADALQEKGGTTFVYTEVDDSGNLSGEVEVQTGLSSDTYVEITSGLSEGQTVYYEQLTGSNIDTSSSSSSQQQMGGGMGAQGGGQMPSGGAPAGQ